MKNKKLIIWVISIILVVTLGVGGYFYFNKTNKCSNKETFISAIEKTFTKSYSKTEEKLTINYEDIKTVNMNIKGKVNIESGLIDSDVLDLINKLGISAGISFDKEKEFGTFNLSATYDNNKLIDGSFYLKNNYVYMFFDGLFDKWIRTEVEYEDGDLFSNDTDLSLDEAKILLSEFKEALVNSLKDRYFTSSKEDDLTKITLEINNDNYQTIIKDIFKYLEDSKDFNKVFDKVSDVSFKDITKSLDESLKSNEKIDPIKISLYMNKKDEIKKVEVKTTTEGQVITVNMEIPSEDNIKLTVTLNNIPYMTGTITSKEEGSITKTNITLSMLEMLTVKIDLESSFEVNESITEPNVNNYVDSSDLSEEDSNKIYENLMNNQAILDLVNAFSAFSNEEEEF